MQSKDPCTDITAEEGSFDSVDAPSRTSAPLNMTSQFDRDLRVGNQGDKLDFQVNNETYFIDLADEEGKWLVFAQTPTGVRRIPVYVDAPVLEDVPVLVQNKNQRKIVN